MIGFDAPIGPPSQLALPPLPSGARLSIQAPGMALGVGGKLWPAASTLCRFLRDEEINGKTLLELGCGTGAVGLYAAALGAQEVLLTDGGGDVLLRVAQQNVELNRALLRSSTVNVAAHDWGDTQSHLPVPVGLDLVVGADLTYARNSHVALCCSIRWIIDEWSPRVILAHEHRRMPLASAGDGNSGSAAESDDAGLANFRQVADDAGLRVTTLLTESSEGATKRADDTWPDLLLVRGQAISLLEIVAADRDRLVA